jgi:serine/threonine protein kinase
MSRLSIGAAASLEGVLLEDGWKVIDPIAMGRNATGGTFSHSYVVQKNERKGFLKAFDFSDAFEPGKETIEFLRLLTSAYEHERDLLTLCKEGRLSKVVTAIAHGSVQVDGFDALSGRVYYIIFEMAEGDVRRQVENGSRFDTLWSLRALRDVCLGLHQVHQRMIAHQDIKPSNVLSYKSREFKIADFGRASIKGRSAPYDGQNVPGDRTYAPPELLYGYTHPDFGPRRMGCDVYMLGNLATFMFTGTNLTSGLLARLDAQFHPSNWRGTYEQVLPYIDEAFSRVLLDIEVEADPLIREFAMRLIRETCNPNLGKRGHPRGVGTPSQYSLERYVQQIENYAARYAIEARARVNT